MRIPSDRFSLLPVAQLRHCEGPRGLTQLGMTGARVSAPLRRDDDFHFDILKCDLVVNQIQQSQRPLIRQVGATEFDPSRLASQFRMRGDHLAIKEERNVGVEFLLQLDGAARRSRPTAAVRSSLKGLRPFSRPLRKDRLPPDWRPRRKLRHARARDR